MNDSISNSLNAIRRLESKQTLNENAAAATAAKGIGRFIPGVGAALGAYDAYGRAKQGDWKGAGLSALGGAAALIPGVGTAASLGIAGAQALRDKQRTGSYMPGDAEIAAGVAKDTAAKPTATATAPVAAPAGADPKVLALQKQLIAKGAKITADGKMGPATQAAMKQFPGTAVVEQDKGNDMSESQRIAELMSRLTQIESRPQVTDENIFAKGAQALKNVGSAFKAGVADPAGAKALAPAATKAGEKAALATGAAVARNPGKIAAGGAAAGAAAGAAGMAALGGAAATKPTTGASAKPTTGASTKPATTTAAAALSTDEEGEMGVLAQELRAMMGKDPALDALLSQYEKLRPGAASAAP